MTVYVYNGVPFYDRDSARLAADRHLNKQLNLQGVYYLWEANPTCSLAVTGIIWRGSIVHSGIMFSADIIEQTVE